MSRVRTGRRARHAPATSATAEPLRLPARDRFRDVDEYRASREWARQEGTAQRALFRELRIRFLRRHAVPDSWVIDVGAGPGRYTPFVGGPGSRRVALDISRVMLAEIGRRRASGERAAPDLTDRVLADAIHPPFRPGTFREVVAIGNVVGFAEGESPQLLEAIEQLVAPGGMLLVEVAPGPGERSRYLHRLPPAAVARMLAAPAPVVVGRVQREGFVAERSRRASSPFRRIAPSELAGRWVQRGWVVRETMAVAPALGGDVDRIQAAWSDATARSRLLALEEEIGRVPARWGSAAAVLLAGTAPAASA